MYNVRVNRPTRKSGQERPWSAAVLRQVRETGDGELYLSALPANVAASLRIIKERPSGCRMGLRPPP